jgi:hypothetical protein
MRRRAGKGKTNMELSIDRIIALRNHLNGVELDQIDSIPGWLEHYAEQLTEALVAETDASKELMNATHYVVNGLYEQAESVTNLSQ